MKPRLFKGIAIGFTIAVWVYVNQSKSNGNTPSIPMEKNRSATPEKQVERVSPSVGETPKRSNPYDGVESIKNLAVDIRKMSDEKVQGKLKTVSGKISELTLVEKANLDQLSDSERHLFAKLMSEEAALKLVLLERKLQKAEDVL